MVQIHVGKDGIKRGIPEWQGRTIRQPILHIAESGEIAPRNLQHGGRAINGIDPRNPRCEPRGDEPGPRAHIRHDHLRSQMSTRDSCIADSLSKVAGAEVVPLPRHSFEIPRRSRRHARLDHVHVCLPVSGCDSS